MVELKTGQFNGMSAEESEFGQDANIPLQDEQSYPSTEDLRWILDRTTAYIRDIDSKNGIVLAALAVAAAVLFSNEWFCGFLTKAVESEDAVQVGFLIFLSMTFVWCLISLFQSLIPRVRSLEGEHSLIYSAGIMRFGSSEGYSHALNNNCRGLREDLVGQVYANAVIAEKKILWHSRSLKAFGVFLILLVVFCVLESVLW